MFKKVILYLHVDCREWLARCQCVFMKCICLATSLVGEVPHVHCLFQSFTWIVKWFLDLLKSQLAVLGNWVQNPPNKENWKITICGFVYCEGMEAVSRYWSSFLKLKHTGFIAITVHVMSSVLPYFLIFSWLCSK